MEHLNPYSDERDLFRGVHWPWWYMDWGSYRSSFISKRVFCTSISPGMNIIIPEAVVLTTHGPSRNAYLPMDPPGVNFTTSPSISW